MRDVDCYVSPVIASMPSASSVRDNEVESLKHEVGSEVGSEADMHRLPQPIKNASVPSVRAK